MCILGFMAAIIAPNIARFAVNQTLGGQPVVNVLDMRISNENPLESREQHLFEVAGDIINNWVDHVMQYQTPDISFNNVTWLDLDSLDGSRGTRSSTSARTLPAFGDFSGQSVMPAVVAARVDKQGSSQRGSRNGRMYIAAFPESLTAVGVSQTWQPVNIDAYNAELAGFLAGINDEAGVNGRDQELVVIHTVNGAYQSYSAVQALTLNPAVSTQVRRGILR